MAIIILGDNNDANVSCGLFLHPNQSRLQVSMNGTYNSGIQYLNSTEWNHFAATYDGNKFKFYINGTLTTDGTYTQAYLQKTNLTIGGESTSANGGHTSIRLPFNGKLNDVRIYDHVLFSREV